MILLSSVIDTFKNEFLDQYANRLLPSHYKALNSMQACRTDESLLMKLSCEDCFHQLLLPHACGHRNCPHCQHQDSQQWLDRQLQKKVPADYFMVTFTLPAEFRPLAWANQRQVYASLIQCAWQTLKQFAENDKQLQGIPGAIAVLHTHARNLDFHPHGHFVIPAAAIHREQRIWRTKSPNGKKVYLFDHRALAKVFRAKLLNGLTNAGLTLPKKYPKKWVVDCKHVGSGEPALIYLGRYLYRGVIQEKDIVACKDNKVTYRWQDSGSGEMCYKTVDGIEFLWKLLQHVLPKRFRRARNFGFLHPNSTLLTINIIRLINFDFRKVAPQENDEKYIDCPCCRGRMLFIQFNIQRSDYRKQPALL